MSRIVSWFPRSKSSKCLIIYSNDDLLQDTLSIDFEILHATLFGITIWVNLLETHPRHSYLRGGAVCIRTLRSHCSPTARASLCIVGSIAPHRLPTQLSFVYQLAAPLQVRAPVWKYRVESRQCESTVREHTMWQHSKRAQRDSTHCDRIHCTHSLQSHSLYPHLLQSHSLHSHCYNADSLQSHSLRSHMHAALLLPPPTHCSPTHCAPIIVLSLNALSRGQGGTSGTVSARLSLACSLSLYSAQTESKERALVSVWERRQEERRGGHASRWQCDTTHRAEEMQRPPDDLPSAAPRSRHSLLPPPRSPPALST